MKVKIQDLVTLESYIVDDRDQCRGSTDRAVFDLVIKMNFPVKMGSVLGQSIKSFDDKFEGWVEITGRH